MKSSVTTSLTSRYERQPSTRKAAQSATLTATTIRLERRTKCAAQAASEWKAARRWVIFSRLLSPGKGAAVVVLVQRAARVGDAQQLAGGPHAPARQAPQQALEDLRGDEGVRQRIVAASQGTPSAWASSGSRGSCSRGRPGPPSPGRRLESQS